MAREQHHGLTFSASRLGVASLMMAAAGEDRGRSGMCLRRRQRVRLGGGGQLVKDLPEQHDVLATGGCGR